MKRSGGGLVLVLGILAGALVLLIVNHDSGRTFSIPNDEFASVAYLGVIGAVIAAGVCLRAALGCGFDSSLRCRE